MNTSHRNTYKIDDGSTTTVYDGDEFRSLGWQTGIWQNALTKSNEFKFHAYLRGKKSFAHFVNDKRRRVIDLNS